VTEKPTDLSDYVEASIREVRPFYWVLMGVLAVMYAWIVISTPAVHETGRLILFTGLMLVHMALHWISVRLTWHRRWLLPYFVLQGGMAFALSMAAGNQGLTLGLYLGLAGEAVGIYEDLRSSLPAVVGMLALSAVNFVVLAGWGALGWWFATVAPTAFFVVVYVIMFVRQIQARQRSQVLLEELEVAHRELAEYAARVEELTRTAERARMARELHDTLAQGLAGLILQLEAMDSHLTRGNPERAQAIAQQAMARARTTLADARRAIDDLRAGADAPADLDAAVRDEIARFTQATGIPCALEMTAPGPLPEAVREHALRGVTEGLSNVARHAGARQAWVSLAQRDDTLEVSVRDDGAGFDPEAVPAGHYGLLGLRERARLAGGTLEVASAPGGGTRVTLRVPVGG